MKFKDAEVALARARGIPIANSFHEVNELMVDR